LGSELPTLSLQKKRGKLNPLLKAGVYAEEQHGWALSVRNEKTFSEKTCMDGMEAKRI